MNKSELVIAVSKTAGITETEAKLVVEATFNIISKTLTSGGDINITGFGSFKTRDRPGRMGRNPMTGGEIQIEAKRVPFFKPGKNLKIALGKPTDDPGEFINPKKG